MSMSLRLCAVPVILTAVLTACAGGGGGGGGSTNVPPAPVAVTFSSFAAIGPNQIVTMPGISQTGSGSGTSFNLDPVSDNASIKLPFDQDGRLSGMTLSAPNAGVSFGTGPDDFGTCNGSSCVMANSTSRAILIDPEGFGWNYQSFGVWMNNLSPSAFQSGAISAGAVTPGSAVPTTSTATFTGHAGGFYFDGAGGRFATDAQMSAVTDFGNRKIQFSTNGTVLTDTGSLAQSLNPGLDLRGNFSYAPGTSQFAGGVNTVDGNLTGNASGRFYGPSAQEIGGVYGLGSSTGARMVGGFGGKR
jgi:hypothetical protein